MVCLFSHNSHHKVITFKSTNLFTLTCFVQALGENLRLHTQHFLTCAFLHPVPGICTIWYRLWDMQGVTVFMEEMTNHVTLLYMISLLRLNLFCRWEVWRSMVKQQQQQKIALCTLKCKYKYSSSKCIRIPGTFHFLLGTSKTSMW